MPSNASIPCSSLLLSSVPLTGYTSLSLLFLLMDMCFVSDFGFSHSKMDCDKLKTYILQTLEQSPKQSRS